jgi:phage recombination protein Bet
MNAPAKTNNKDSSPAIHKEQLIAVLGQSLYVGVKSESISMIIDYCNAAGLDVMQKPVHAVPMNTKNPVSGNYEWRDVVMPGIGLYRIQADRSKNMAGISEPEFGPIVTKTLTDKNGNAVEVSFPEWCKVTAHKLVGDQIVSFVAKEYWEENYATDSGKSTAPNAMWRKRPRGQIAKCTEAQALRKGWPEVGAAPTAEEMEGKTLDAEYTVVDDRKSVNHQPEELPVYDDKRFQANLPKYSKAIADGSKTADDIIAAISTRYQMTDEQKDAYLEFEADILTQKEAE